MICQSGETAHTLVSLGYAEAQSQHTLAMVDVPTSTIAEASSAMMPTFVHPEIGVASTNAFCCQLTVLLCFARAANMVASRSAPSARIIDPLITAPGLMAEGPAREIAKGRNEL